MPTPLNLRLLSQHLINVLGIILTIQLIFVSNGRRKYRHIVDNLTKSFQSQDNSYPNTSVVICTEGRMDLGQNDEELGPSELGTKDYWLSIYDRDKKNYDNHGDVGEIWFGEDSEIRVIRWMTQNNIPTDAKIIDLGCGNGMMLIELARENYRNLTGVDYCENAIELCKKILQSQSIDCIDFMVADLTGKNIDLKQYDLALDKGTYDAISLDPNDAPAKKRKYIENVSFLLKENGLLIITSCNWTESEVINQFKTHFKHKHTVPTPTFQFGGKIGNIVSTVVFEKSK